VVDLDREKRRLADGYRTRGEPVPDYLRGTPVLPPAPAEDVLGAPRVVEAEPFVQETRQRVFGSTEPPFPGEDDPEAQTWMVESLTRRMRGTPSKEDRTLEEAVRLISDGTGFRPLDVKQWIVYGQAPRLHRAILHTREVKVPLPNGTVLRRRYASVTFNAPVKEEEVRQMWGEHLVYVWGDGPVSDAVRKRGPTITEMDRHLDSLMIHSPGEEGWVGWAALLQEWKNTPPDGWTAGEWKEDRHRNVTENALRIRWHRLKKTKRKFHPQGEED